MKTLDFRLMNEWVLAFAHADALKAEDFETCAKIKAEIDARIEADTLDRAFMDGFRYYNPKTQQFEGEYKVENLNGLFDKYIEKYPPNKENPSPTTTR